MEQTEILIRLRKEKGLSQAEVAEELGVTRQAVSRWEAGRAWPSAENLVALSRMYGMTVEEMMHGHKEGTEAEEPSVEEGGQEEIEPDQQEEQAQCSSHKRQWWLVLAAIFCGGVFLWGKLTNSLFFAMNYLVFAVSILGLGWLIYLSCAIYKYIRRNGANEKD